MRPTSDNHHLERLVRAQEGVYGQALAELKRGRKSSHWMWFVFPQLDGLGKSETARFYAIQGREEAAAYLAHPLLGLRLIECCGAILTLETLSALEIFGSPDDMKLRSSMTLFAAVPGSSTVFEQVIAKYFGGRADVRTLELLAEGH